MEGALTAVPGADPARGTLLPAAEGSAPLVARPADTASTEALPSAGPLTGAVSGRELRGSRCARCAVTVYPADTACPRCGGPAVPVVLSGAGTLWTWTVQRYAPKSPPYEAPGEGFQPFAVGYVELPEGVRILAVLHGMSPEDLRIGIPVTITAGDGVPRARPAGPAGVTT
ncbi:OB-fold domain-containing protein [Streptomyces sp. NPDC046862]|uniref:Zn-ribbon domain-containing OB-fold protein n=1 Tax=Streptomyces sp. NPDC046862 TaxID=3154603 RepID=UPI0034556F3F